nr:tyrosine-type recombinase/integrase [Pseudonocardiales bacterium]
MATPDLTVLLASWSVHLQAEGRSAGTLESYLTGVRLFLRHCEAAGIPAVLDRRTVNEFVAGMLAAGAAPATARARHMALRRYSAWLADEGEIGRDELLGLKPPRLDVKVVPRLSEDECRALVKACTGKEFVDRRDEALVRFLLETATRAGEVIAMGTADVDVVRGVAAIRRGKGGKGRVVPFGPHTGRAIDRYMRLRRAHRRAVEPALWLGGGGPGVRLSRAES